MRKLTQIIIHCSATPVTMNIGATEIRQWHVSGNGWSDIGYHYVIRRDGRVEEGRPISKKGAHAAGYNENSVGICLVGGLDVNNKPDANFSMAQYLALHDLVLDIVDRFGELEILGHRDLPGVTKACPCFDVKAWATEL